ncbi:MAG: DUF333 domain-containing protein [Patescibacteria group bacterium]|jgi:hypothetical protein
MKKTFKVVIGLILAVLAVIALVAIAGMYKFNFNKDTHVQPEVKSVSGNQAANDQLVETAAPVQMANPASTNCVNQGGKLEIETRGDGGQYGLCYFEDNRACEEWALMRGDCPVGGRRTTGFDTIDQKYCAWLGGDTYAMPDSICTFKDGSKCSTIDFYNGKCPAAL